MLYSIDELPFHERIQGENILIGGLWHGDAHPNMLSFLSPQMTTLNNLKTNGIKINQNISSLWNSMAVRSAFGEGNQRLLKNQAVLKKTPMD